MCERRGRKSHRLPLEGVFPGASALCPHLRPTGTLPRTCWASGAHGSPGLSSGPAMPGATNPRPPDPVTTLQRAVQFGDQGDSVLSAARHTWPTQLPLPGSILRFQPQLLTLWVSSVLSEDLPGFEDSEPGSVAQGPGGPGCFLTGAGDAPSFPLCWMGLPEVCSLASMVTTACTVLMASRVSPRTRVAQDFRRRSAVLRPQLDLA